MIKPIPVMFAVLTLVLLLPVHLVRAQAENSDESTEQTATGSAATPTPDATDQFSIGGATITLGMSQAEVYAQVDKNRDTVKWFEMDLDSAPTSELLKMDNWALVYSEFTGTNLRSGVLMLVFTNEKLIKLDNRENQ